jgi:hypothetical protein
VVLAACVAPLLGGQAPAGDPHLGIPIGGGPIEVGPIPTGLESLDATSCGECHPRHLREWRGSAHGSSGTNAVFLAELGERRNPFCVRCHAPRGAPEAGVDCAACHVRQGAVLNPTVSGRAPHESRAEPNLAGTIACARCHDFAFERQPDLRLQATVEEWMTSTHRDESCQGCHMPRRGAHHAHHFPGGLDDALVRDALRVEARAERSRDDTRVTLQLSAAAAGHAVPTGDIFRRIEVRAWPTDRPRHAETRWLARRFDVDSRGWHAAADDRVPAAGTREVTLELLGVTDRVAVRVYLWRVARERAERFGWPERDVRRLLWSGTVPVTRR